MVVVDPCKPAHFRIFFLDEPCGPDIFVLKGMYKFHQVAIAAAVKVHIMEGHLLVMVLLIILLIYGNLQSFYNGIHSVKILIRQAPKGKGCCI